ncbi:MAG: holo-ACP synthase [Clostridia bacterium]|nr:holo-ACP synthase [Clostridia bacterium]MDD4048111.1 holo-ACP synthase [Clostridia bacterium]
MIYIGSDIIEIERILKTVARHPALWERVLTEREIKYCKSKGNPIQSFAGRFAAKEAVLKCLGQGLKCLSWHNLEILPDDLGCPQVSFELPLEKIMKAKNIISVNLSISHSRCYAMAVAVGEVKQSENNIRN